MSNVKKTFHGDIAMQTGSILTMEDGAEFSGSLIPANADSSLGTGSRPFKDAFLSSGSLFIDGRKVLSIDEARGIMVLGGPNNEDVLINASGSGRVIITNDLKVPSGTVICPSITASSIEISEMLSPSGLPITGSLFGTASVADNTQTASFALAAPMVVTFFDGFIGKYQVSLFSTVGELPNPGDSSPDKLTVRTKLDLTNYREARLLLNVLKTDASAGNFAAQYSLNETTWSYLDGSTGPSASIDAVGVRTHNWAPLVSESKADVFIRLVGSDPDQKAPEFGHISIQVR